ncbi:MAG: hypothetical protein ACT4P0_10635 [Panacagrimonas sp.]
MLQRRRNHYDVTNRVRVSHPEDVLVAVCALLSGVYPDHDLTGLRTAYRTFSNLYAGTLPGYLGCDTWYHDAQHSLDTSLAMARLIDGYERTVQSECRLGPRRATLGVIVALFHDAGYLRGAGDSARNGAEYTLTHVQRSSEMLRMFLPEFGFGDDAKLGGEIVHFTGWEKDLDDINISAPLDRMLGFLLGSADLLAQAADRCYLEKCRSFLFREFEIAGLAGAGLGKPYPTVETLLDNTPEFNRGMLRDRLEGYFCSAYRYMDKHFDGLNPYKEMMDRNMEFIDRLGKSSSFHQLKRRPRSIDAVALIKIMGIAD